MNRMRCTSGRWRAWRRPLSQVGGAALLALILVGGALPAPAWADSIDTTGEVIGADVDGTIALQFDPGGGPVTGTIDMTVTFDCQGKTRYEHHLLDITKGTIDGDRITATAVYVERSGLPKDELSRCKSAYETYHTREDSRRLVGTIDEDGQWASGTLGEYHPTVSWRIIWATPADPGASDEAAASAS
jgi:hypothetical protein